MGGWWGGGRVQEGERMGGYVNSWGMKSEWVEDGEWGGGEEGGWVLGGWMSRGCVSSGVSGREASMWEGVGEGWLVDGWGEQWADSWV